MTKDGMPTPGLNGRKSSISQGQGAIGSNMQGRPGTRRRETSDSTTGNPLATPSTFGRGSREDAPIATPPSSLLRRRTDFKEGSAGSPFEKTRLDTGIETGSPFAPWKRNVPGPMSAGVTGPSSPWAPSGPQSAGFGAFGNFSIDNTTAAPSTPAEKRLGFGSLRGESRFKGLMGKDSSEDMSSKTKEKPSAGLEKLSEFGSERQGASNPAQRRSSNFFEDEERIGSAALGGDVPSPPLRGHIGNVDSKRTHDEIGFASFNTPSSLGAIREIVGRRETGSQGNQGQHSGEHTHEPMSPTDTNPYQSPEGDKSMEGESEDDSRQTPFSLRNQSRTLTAAYDGDRSQTSSAGQQRPFPPLSSLGGLGDIGGAAGPWSAAPGIMGQQSRAGQGFGSVYTDSLFGPMGDLSSPGGAFGTPTSSAFPSTTRSKMGSLFPTQMQDQMRNEVKSEGTFTDRTAFTPLSRDPEISSQAARGVLDDLFGPSENQGSGADLGLSPFGKNEGVQSGYSQSSSADSGQATLTQAQSTAGTVSAAPLGTPSGGSSLFGRSPEPDANANQPPPAQQRQMVMPDRMRWIYRDPTGNTQGPFSGLEMHDWYKAGFFSPELQVKKLEDTDYEPLAQLIRRIGNSREPFLVPQIGIPHGQPAAPGVLGAPTPGSQPGNQPPPLGNSFPSFGTTLTAEQQNALERRKQEEQYLMARQKEHLAQQQAYMKQFPMSGMPMYPQQLHHHSSAHSLQSQPSYGSITSPGGFQPSPGQLPLHTPASNIGFFDSPMRSGFAGQAQHGDAVPNSQEGGLPAMDRLSLGPTSQTPLGAVPQSQEGFSHQQQVATMAQDRARLQAQQQQWDALQQDDGRDNAERLDQFNQLRAQEDGGARPSSGPIIRSANQEAMESTPAYHEQRQGPPQGPIQQSNRQPQIDTNIYEQIQPAPKEIAPQPSTSPLPAPAAQRNRQYIAEVLAAESGSRSQSPVETPTAASIAPWAKESVEGSKGPSLKEIQEAEARASSQREEMAAAVRRAAAEQERVALERAAVQAPAPGLPTTANWAASPVTSTNPAVPWTKPTAGKTVTPTTSAKKTIAQIQKEEEARKVKAATATATVNANVAATATVAGGKRYADLASKVTSPTASTNTGGAWTTVGASGKAKVPSSPAVASTPTRTASGGLSTPPTASVKPKPAAPTRSNTGATSIQSAHDEFQKWVKNSLGKGLNSGVNGL